VEGKFNQLLSKAKEYKRSAYADSTKKTYRSQLSSFFKFCLEHNKIPIPVEQCTLVAYVAHLANRLLPASIPGYLNVIRLLHVEAGLKNPLSENLELALLKRGINRLKGQPPHQKLPITPAILCVIYGLLNMDLPSDAAFWLALLIGFFGFLRKSTLLPMTRNPVAGKFISRGDVQSISLESFSVVIRHSKVIQFGQRFLTIPYFRVLDTKLCPVRALLRHFGLSVLPSAKPLFDSVVSGRTVSLIHSGFVARLKTLLTAAGVDARLYSAHSLRRGGATFAFQAGLSPLEIKRRGDWASSAYERYIHLDQETALDSSRMLASAVLSR
jgi:integrase